MHFLDREVFDLLVPLIFFSLPGVFSQYNLWLSVFVAVHRTLRFLLSVSGIYRPLFNFINRPTVVLGYLKLRVLLVNEPFSLAWSSFLN